MSLVSASIIAGTEVLNSGLSGLSSELIFGLSQGVSGPSSWLNGGLNAGLIVLSQGLSDVWIIMISGFIIMWALSGGLTILRHYAIRWFLARSQTLPWRMRTFLDDATTRILLQRVGGGYRFMYRLELDYFADLETAPPSATSPTAPPRPNMRESDMKCR